MFVRIMLTIWSFGLLASIGGAFALVGKCLAGPPCFCGETLLSECSNVNKTKCS